MASGPARTPADADGPLLSCSLVPCPLVSGGNREWQPLARRAAPSYAPANFAISALAGASARNTRSA
jgi:hypothetical protein